MANSSMIETGVDKLVNLINQKKKISVQDAAKTLGVTQVVVEEWADFLEEEGLISIEYKLATTYLVERKLTKKEAQKKEKEFHDTKDTFIRDVDTTISSLDSETASIEHLKQQFRDLKTELGSDLDHVKEELWELDNYEVLKKDIDKKIQKYQSDYQDKISVMEKQLLTQRKKYESILDSVTEEKVKIDKEKQTVDKLRKQEQELLNKLSEFNDIAKNIRKLVQDEESQIDISEKHVRQLEKTADDIITEINNNKEKLDPLIKQNKEYEREIDEKQKAIIEKVMKNRKNIEGSIAKSKDITKSFKNFFDKKSQVEDLVNKIDKDKESLRADLNKLIDKAHAFNIVSNTKDGQKHIKELEGEFKKIETKRKEFKGEIGSLVKYIKKQF